MNIDCQESNPHRRTIEAAAPALSAFRMWGDVAQRFMAYLLRSSEVLLLWLKRSRQWRGLDRLSEHTLKDIGPAWADIEPSMKDLS